MKEKDPISHYIVCDSDGNALDNVVMKDRLDRVKGLSIHDHPDDAWRTARHVVREVWQDREVGTICGMIGAVAVPLVRFYRGGPPGSKTVVFEAVGFEHLTLKESPL